MSSPFHVVPLPVEGVDPSETVRKTIKAGKDGNMVLFPAGTWSIDQARIPSGVRIQGQGRGRTILKAISTACPLLNADLTNGNGNIEIRGLTIDGDSKVIDFLLRLISSVPGGCSDCTVEDVELKNGLFGGLQFAQMQRGSVWKSYFHDNGRDGAQFSSGQDILVQGNRIFDNGDDSLSFVAADGPMERVSAVGNILGNVESTESHAGILFAGVKDGVAVGNVIPGGTSGVTVMNFNDQAAENIVVVGNPVKGENGVEIAGWAERGGTAEAGVGNVVVVGNSLPKDRGVLVNTASQWVDGLTVGQNG